LAEKVDCNPWYWHLLELVLASEANMHPELKTDEKKRAECLGKALAEAIEMCGFYEYEYNRELVSDGDPEVVQALLSPPAHWGPVSPDVLAEGLRAATPVVGGDEVAGAFTVIIYQAVEQGRGRPGRRWRCVAQGCSQVG
jgi:hypothetical protein